MTSDDFDVQLSPAAGLAVAGVVSALLWAVIFYVVVLFHA